VTVKVAHGNSLQSSLTRLGYCSSVAALLIFFGCDSLQSASAEGETRTLSLHHMHTSENLTITYKVNGRYDENALAKLNTLLRDWREEKATAMDPHLLDLLWEVHRAVGAKEPVWVVCGYRSPSTNAMLRRRSGGVAQFSQHMNGKAIDFYIPGVPLDELRAAGLRAQRGGVGFYPSSGSPFVHLDTGNVRHWPRMPEAQLASLLAKGPLSSRSASDARGTAFAQGDISRPLRKPSLLAKLFGNGKDADEEADAAAAAARNPDAKFIAGGTNLLDLMKLEIETPKHLIDVNGLGLDKIEPTPDGGLRIGALVRNTDLAADSTSSATVLCSRAGRSVASAIIRALSMSSSALTEPRPWMFARPRLVVASALKPSPAKSRAVPASHGLGMIKVPGSSCSARSVTRPIPKPSTKAPTPTTPSTGCSTTSPATTAA